MRNIFKLMLFIAFGTMIFVSCEEDKFTEKDAMDELQKIDMAFTVQDGSSYGEVVEGATVSILKDSASSSTVEKTTDASGNVIFEDMQIGGNVSVRVTKDNYTKAIFRVNVSTNSYRTSQISETFKIYPLDGENMATVKGQLTLETDLTNRVREKLSGREVKVVNTNFSNSNIESSFVGTTDDDGKYSIQVPVNASGNDDLRIKFPSEVEATQTLAMETGETYEVVTKPVVYYSSNYSQSQIPSIPSAIASIESPNGVGSGFELGVEAKGTPFTAYSSINLIKGGSGYHIENGTDTLLPMSEGIKGDTTWATVEISKSGADSSSITDIYVNSWDDNGKYTSEPSLDVSVLGGSGALFDIKFESEYLVYIENYGTDYQTIPTVSATYKEYDGDNIVKRTDEDLNAGNELTAFGGQDFNNFITISNGKLYPDNTFGTYDGDTLFATTKGLTEMPELNISSSEGQQAKMKFVDNFGNILIDQNDSTITGFNLTQDGEGYDPADPPEINITSVAGYGTDAEFYAEVNSDGTFSAGSITIKNEGEGYVRNVNDFLGTGYTNNHNGHDFNGDTYINNVGPGDVEVSNAYYGTGERQEEE